MSALDDLREHPVPVKPWLLDDPDAQSFHEVVCDLARCAQIDPEHCVGLPTKIQLSLVAINAAVVRVASYLRDMERGI